MAFADGKSLRLIIFSAVMFGSVSLYAMKLFSMQILQGESYRRQSKTISQR
jgi:cell division protein FtsI/penicillin-binding protein 2